MMRGLLHLLLGGAAAAALAGIAVAMVFTLLNASGIARWATALLILAAAALVARLLVIPTIRPVEAQLARLLLDAGVPELSESQDRQARLEGAVWAGIVLLTGGACLFLLLLLVPSGVALLLPLGSGEPLQVAGTTYHPDLAGRMGLAVLGVLLVAAAGAVQPLGVRLLRRWAPVWLRPSGDELLAAERARSRDLARSNAVARDLHDSIGHALTAIGVQAEAALVTGRPEPVAAIRDLAHGAVDDLDRVLGALRDRTAAAPVHRFAEIGSVADRFPGTVQIDLTGDVPDPEVADAAYRIVQEAVTNGVRHGVPPVRAVVVAAADGVRIEVANAVRAGVTDVRGGRGIAGMTERAHLVGGTFEAGPDGSQWRVRAQLPGEAG